MVADARQWRQLKLQFRVVSQATSLSDDSELWADIFEECA
jgi:hypothetical protein